MCLSYSSVTFACVERHTHTHTRKPHLLRLRRLEAWNMPTDKKRKKPQKQTGRGNTQVRGFLPVGRIGFCFPFKMCQQETSREPHNAWWQPKERGRKGTKRCFVSLIFVPLSPVLLSLETRNWIFFFWSNDQIYMDDLCVYVCPCVWMQMEDRIVSVDQHAHKRSYSLNIVNWIMQTP